MVEIFLLIHFRRWEGSKIRTGASLTILEAFRSFFDMLLDRSVAWEPYTADVMARLPPYCVDHSIQWRCVVPLICFCYVEWHQPDRCVRQFGTTQSVPVRPYQDPMHHLVDLRSSGKDWPRLFENEVALWNDRLNRTFDVLPQDRRPIRYHSDYMDWYTRSTRRWVTPNGALMQAVVSTFFQSFSKYDCFPRILR